MKAVNKQAVEHNLAFAIKKAFMDKDEMALHKAADDILGAGYELEDMKITPALMSVIVSALIETGWYPMMTNTPSEIYK